MAYRIGTVEPYSDEPRIHEWDDIDTLPCPTSKTVDSAGWRFGPKEEKLQGDLRQFLTARGEGGCIRPAYRFASAPLSRGVTGGDGLSVANLWLYSSSKILLYFVIIHMTPHLATSYLRDESR